MTHESQAMTRTDEGAGQAWMDRLEGFRCRTCRRLLLKVTPDPLKRGAALEVKCACKTLNYLMGA